MKLSWAAFFFGTTVTDSSFVLDLQSGATVFAVRVPYGSWAPKSFRAVLEANILSQTGLACLVDFNYTTRAYRLTFPSSVTLLGATGGNASISVLPVLGLPSTDQTGTVFTGSGGQCSVFYPNFPLTAFTDKVNTLEFFGLTASETAGQLREVVSFGERRFYRYSMRYLTDTCGGLSSSYLRMNPSALSQARAYLRQVLSLQGIDFFTDADLIGNNYTTRPTDTIQRSIANESADQIELEEMTGDGLQGFYQIAVDRFDVFNLTPLSDTTPAELARLLQEMGDLILQEDGGGILL